MNPTIRPLISRFVVFTLVVFTGIVSLSAVKMTGTNVKNDSLVIFKSAITDKATYFPFVIDGVKMELFAVKASDGTIRTALNTCQVCFNSGRGWYVQDGIEMVCQNCGNRFGINKIEQIKNGCNPIPITKDLKTEDKTLITISAEVLASGKQFFAKWKK